MAAPGYTSPRPSGSISARRRQLLPDWRKTRAIELAPKNWRETLAKPETQALLDELRLLRDEDASA